MKKNFRLLFDKLFSPVAHKMGYKKLDYENTELYSKNNLLHNFYSILNKIDFTPKHIVDVGANHGTWTRECLKFFPESYYTLIEPQYQMQESIKDILATNSRVKFHAMGAGDAEGTLMFTIVDRDDSCSFAYTKQEAKDKGFEQVEVPVITLNNLLPKTNTPIPDIIKIDAEGIDIKVLTGANNYFGKTEVFMVEAGVMNKAFDNSVLKVMTLMDKNGYRLFDITDLNRTLNYNALWLAELVFIKKEGIIDKTVASYN